MSFFDDSGKGQDLFATSIILDQAIAPIKYYYAKSEG
jgi:hypothetical protein